MQSLVARTVSQRLLPTNHVNEFLRQKGKGHVVRRQIVEDVFQFDAYHNKSFLAVIPEAVPGLQIIQRHLKVGDFVVFGFRQFAGIDIDLQAGKQQPWRG